jgi:methionyl-tRNA formyltransferase
VVSKPVLAYAGNRHIGLTGLEMLVKNGWRPSILVLPRGSNAEFAMEMRSIVPEAPLLEGLAFREPEGISLLKDLGLDYFLSVHFPYLIPKEILSLPRIGTLNLHPAYLPFNRGWHTPSWAIHDGTPYGATLHWVDEGLDTGDIALQRGIDVRPDDTAHTLYQRVMYTELELLKESIPQMLQGTLPRTIQEGGGTSHRKEDLRSIQRLDLIEKRPVGEIIDILRSLTTNRWAEAAFFETGGRRYRLRLEVKEDVSDD